jgi:hypothetical protein
MTNQRTWPRTGRGLGRRGGTPHRANSVTCRRTLAVRCLAMLLPLLVPCRAIAQDATGADPVQSMGFPSTWKPYVGASLLLSNTGTGTAAGGQGLIGMHKELMDPIVGGPALRGEAYLGGTSAGVDGGARLLLAIPVIWVAGGVDYSISLDRTDFILSLMFPTTRGGYFHTGAEARLDWIPARDQSFEIGIRVPVFQRYMGKTRQYKTEVDLPRPSSEQRRKPVPHDEMDSLMAEVHRRGTQMLKFSSFFFDDEGGSYQESLTRARTRARDVKAILDAPVPPGAAPPSYASTEAAYHRALDAAFGAALTGGRPDTALGQPMARQAESIVFGQVILPYDRRFGQYKQPNSLLGLGTSAHDQFRRWLDGQTGLAPAQRTSALDVFDRWLAVLDHLRSEYSLDSTNDSRLIWLPMQLAIRPDQHDDQAEIDAIIERLVRQDFTEDNAALYLSGQQFLFELSRMIRQTEHYQVLWIHDFRGMTPEGRPDRVAFAMTLHGYMANLRRKVEAYQRTGSFPTYMIFLDQNYYEANKGKTFLGLLNDPLGAPFSLPGRDSLSVAMQAALRASQDSLRAAVASASRLQAAAARHPDPTGWLRQTIRVHVSITNPSDLSFRSNHLLGLPFAPDNLMRDHRKLAFRDVTDSDPASGEAIFTGVGIGEHYATPTWDDRAILVSGSSLLELKAQARLLLLQQGFKESEIPAPLQPQAKPADYDSLVAALEARGAVARGMNLHNKTGWDQKDASIIHMALYNLMPPGSVLYIPDSIWTNFLWAGQLVAAALRGCHVYVVAPAVGHAPSDAPFTMSRMQETYVRLAVVYQELEPELEAAGGALHVGVYTRKTGIGDLGASADEVADTYQKYPFLKEEFPFTPAFFAELRRLADSLSRLDVRANQLLQDEVERAVTIHRKTQFFGTREVLGRIAGSPEMLQLLKDWTTQLQVPFSDSLSHVAIQDRPELQALRPLRTALNALPPELRSRAVTYLTVGSLNKDYRSAVLDGEAVYLLSGDWSLIGWPDFFAEWGFVTWVTGPEELEQYLPPYTDSQRWLGRRLRRIL